MFFHSFAMSLIIDVWIETKNVFHFMPQMSAIDVKKTLQKSMRLSSKILVLNKK